MSDNPYPDPYHRWNWFRKSQWWPDYRDRMLNSRGGSCGIVLEVVGDPAGKIVLDATCGLGRKTLVLSHLGLTVMGSDANAYTVEKARELAASESREIEFFVSEWRTLPERTSHRFDAIFVDAFLDCCESYEDLVASFAGIAATLKAGGVFIYFGPEPEERMSDILDHAWTACEQFYVEWQHAEEGCDCTCLHARGRGDDYIDDHHLYLIREGNVEPRLETATLRQWFRWDRKRLDEAARSAGFSRVHTQSFEGYAFDGSTIKRIIAAHS
jgi:SAM-dependent methyltransferase